MFGWTRIFTLVAVAAAVAIVTGGAGATSTSTLAPATVAHATSSGKVSTAASRRGTLLKTANLSTRAGAVRYLRAIGLDPRGLVIQRGARNYAGPNCPGAGWACTSTAHPVVQITAAGGRNTFFCTTGSCAVVQATRSGTATKTRSLTALALAPANKAACVKTTGLSQSCTINQTSASADNTAIVFENVPKSSGLTQTASATAQITQRATGATNSNTACVNQNINVDGSTTSKKGVAVTVTLEAHQSVVVTQDSAHGGNSVANATSVNCDLANPLTQMQTLTSTATGSGLVNQYENKSSSGPNVYLDIEQNQTLPDFKGNPSVSGVNKAVFSQTNALTAIAVTPNGAVNQTQSSASGGIQAIVNQWSHDDAHPSTISATQTETQCEHAQVSSTPSPSCDLTHQMTGPTQYLPTQIQSGPVSYVGSRSPTTASRSLAFVRKDPGSTQGDNPNDSFTIIQNSTQNSDTQPAQAQNQSNNVQGACSTSGYCTATQTTTVDGQSPTTNTQSGQNVDTTTSCTGSACTGTSPAGITFDGSPGTGPPPSILGPYTMTAFGTDSQPSCSDTGSTVTGVIDAAGAIAFTPALHHGKTPAPGCWATWSHGYNGDVYDTASAADTSQAKITLPSGTNAFYFYAEPNQLSPFTIQATAQNGTTTSGPVSVNGNGGAQYFGFYGTGGMTLAFITVTTSDPFGFAVGEFGIQVAPVG